MINYLSFILTIMLACPHLKAQDSNDFEAELRALEEKSQEIENKQMNAVLKLESIEVGEGMVQDFVNEEKSSLKKSGIVPDQGPLILQNSKETPSTQKRRRIPSR